jgi:hypothetical protein
LDVGAGGFVVEIGHLTHMPSSLRRRANQPQQKQENIKNALHTACDDGIFSANECIYPYNSAH